jgi:hypothetical protein
MEEDEGNDGVEDGRSKNFRFDEYEVRDAFLEFMTSLMSGYTKCLVFLFLFIYRVLECT